MVIFCCVVFGSVFYGFYLYQYYGYLVVIVKVVGLFGTKVCPSRAVVGAEYSLNYAVAVEKE